MKTRSNRQKILVVHTACIGDVILLSSFLRELKKVFPRSSTHIVVIPGNVELFRNNPNVHKIHPFDKTHRKWLAFFRLVKTIRKEKYDLTFLVHSSLTTVLLVLLGGIKNRIGFDRRLAASFLKQKTPFRRNVLRLEKNLDLLKILSDRSYDIQTEIFPDKQMFDRADALLKSLFPKRAKYVALAPGSKWYTKRWLSGYYGQLAQMLSDRGYATVFIGSGAESNLCETIRPERNSINLAGRLSLRESAAVVQKCDLMICNDSGTLHLANAVCTDVVAIFGPTDRSLGYFPFRKDDTVIEKTLDCRPCGNHGHKKCPLGHHNCMKLIEPDQVFEVVLTYLEQSNP